MVMLRGWRVRAVQTFAVVLLLVGAGTAQRYDGEAKKNLGSYIAAIPGALVKVCSNAGTGTPCSPGVTLYTDSTLTTSTGSSTLTADANGNYHFYTTPGLVEVQETDPVTGITYTRHDVVIYTPFAGSTTSAGVFTNTSNHCGLTSMVNGAAMTMFSSSGAGSYTQDAVCGGVIIPVGATVTQANGVTGMVENHSDGPVVTNGTASMGGYFQTHNFGSNTATWGVNTVGVLMTGGNNATLQNEVDFDIQSGVTGAIVNGWVINFPYFDSAPAGAIGVTVIKPGCTTPNFGTYAATGCPQLGYGYKMEDGAAPVALYVGKTGTGNNKGSAAIQFKSTTSGGVDRTATLNTDQNGSLDLTPGSGGSVVLVGPTVTTGNITTSTGTITGANLKSTSGVAAGAGMQHVRVAGCATAATVGAVCTTTVTWGVAFADTSYSAACNGDLVTSGVPTDGGLSAKTTTTVTFRTIAATAAAAQSTTVDCVAMHD
jgi:hypothetical protein